MLKCEANVKNFKLNHDDTNQFLLTVFGEYESVRGNRNFANTISVGGDDSLSSIYDYTPIGATNVRHSLWDNRDEFLAFVKRQNNVRNIDKLYVLNSNMNIILESWNGSNLADIIKHKQDDDIIVLIEFPSRITVL